MIRSALSQKVITPGLLVWSALEKCSTFNVRLAAAAGVVAVMV